MQVISPDLIRGKKVLLRMDIDVPLKEGRVLDVFRLQKGLETLHLCLDEAEKVIIMGHIGRPGGKEDLSLSVEPVANWFEKELSRISPPKAKLHILENLRFEDGEEGCDPNFAKELASYGNFYVNEAFAAHHEASSTTILPTLLPHAAGLQFAKEVKALLEIRQNPQRPLIAIIGGVKVEDKYEAIKYLSTISEAVLVGGLIAQKIKDQNLEVASNVLVGKNNTQGIDLAPETVLAFSGIIKHAKQIIWSGPLGKYEDPQGNEGTNTLAQAVVDSGAESIIGGGDTIAALEKLNLLDKFSFVSTGGGAMLELLCKGTLPTIEALA